MSTETFVGIGFGTDTDRSVAADAHDREAAGVAVAPHARWGQGLYGDPHAQQLRSRPEFPRPLEDLLARPPRRQERAARCALTATSALTGALQPNSIISTPAPRRFMSFGFMALERNSLPSALR